MLISSSHNLIWSVIFWIEQNKYYYYVLFSTFFVVVSVLPVITQTECNLNDKLILRLSHQTEGD